jgi:hypothetical protein
VGNVNVEETDPVLIINVQIIFIVVGIVAGRPDPIRYSPPDIFPIEAINDPLIVVEDVELPIFTGCDPVVLVLIFVVVVPVVDP